MWLRGLRLLERMPPVKDESRGARNGGPSRRRRLSAAYRFAMRSQSFSFCGNISKMSSSAIRLCGMRTVNGRVYIFGSSNVISTSM